MNVDEGNCSRFAACPIADGGTSSAAWLDWLAGHPALDFSTCSSLTVVAAHPDDETYGFGGAAAALRARGVEVRWVSVTDGGGAFPDWSPARRTALEATRRGEVRRAAHALGIDDVIELGLPDGELESHEGALSESLVDLLTDRPPGSWCAATWRGDGHPDHEAVGRAAAAACDRTSVRLLEYPIWMWHWAQPGDVAVPWSRMQRVAVDASARAGKVAAAGQFHSQTTKPVDGEAILPPHVVNRLMTVGEVVFV
ncbi:PIG-L family deacetylase [Mycolicibacterium arabiense]|uniref:PIG-L family deacetylase n=1 Tax=Mycolicibacterium arabiense TaxID=1286181 RepID=A0A7I7S4B9_9MYCO|nr:PIG-L family deacetylase [Mycolicibacterium arabiense]MCV7376901.1 PIG-L family deacetylase [Mycolicibacterium arabiense]BBY51764.1 PIG-L family deacetylase [Mycolicibacterium arabiense]